jgi:hypothetical protein
MRPAAWGQSGFYQLVSTNALTRMSLKPHAPCLGAVPAPGRTARQCFTLAWDYTPGFRRISSHPTGRAVHLALCRLQLDVCPSACRDHGSVIFTAERSLVRLPCTASRTTRHDFPVASRSP